MFHHMIINLTQNLIGIDTLKDSYRNNDNVSY